MNSICSFVHPVQITSDHLKDESLFHVFQLFVLVNVGSVISWWMEWLENWFKFCQFTWLLVSLFLEWQRYSGQLFLDGQSEEFYEALGLGVE